MLEIAAPFEQMFSSTRTPAEGAGCDDDRQSLVLAEDTQRRSAQIGTGGVAAVGGEAALDHLHPTTADEHRATATALAQVAGAVALCEMKALDRELRAVLVLAVRRRPDLRRVARVHVEDATLAGPAERHPAAAVEHDDGGSVDHLGGVGHDDGDRVRPAVEGDDPAVRHRIDNRLRRAARRRAVRRSPRRDARCRLGAPRRAVAHLLDSRVAATSDELRAHRPLPDRRSAARRHSPRPPRRAHPRFPFPGRTLRPLRVRRARRRLPVEASRAQYRRCGPTWTGSGRIGCVGGDVHPGKRTTATRRRIARVDRVGPRPSGGHRVLGLAGSSPPGFAAHGRGRARRPRRRRQHARRDRVGADRRRRATVASIVAGHRRDGERDRCPPDGARSPRRSGVRVGRARGR